MKSRRKVIATRQLQRGTKSVNPVRKSMMFTQDVYEINNWKLESDVAPGKKSKKFSRNSTRFRTTARECFNSFVKWSEAYLSNSNSPKVVEDNVERLRLMYWEKIRSQSGEDLNLYRLPEDRTGNDIENDNAQPLSSRKERIACSGKKDVQRIFRKRAIMLHVLKQDRDMREYRLWKSPQSFSPFRKRARLFVKWMTRNRISLSYYSPFIRKNDENISISVIGLL